jgi:hypothetical protein
MIFYDAPEIKCLEEHVFGKATRRVKLDRETELAA